MNTGDARATAIGAYRYTSTGGNLNLASATSGANSVDCGTVTVAGFAGSKDITVNAGDSARTIAAAVNAEEANTGVTARAITQAQISSVGSGTVKFDLSGQGTATVTATVNDPSDLSELARAINDSSGTTGVFAKLSATKASITLENQDGYDIGVASDTNATSSFDLAGLEEDGITATAAQTVVPGGGSQVGGRVIFESSKSFSVADSGGDVSGNAVDAAALSPPKNGHKSYIPAMTMPLNSSGRSRVFWRCKAMRI